MCVHKIPCTCFELMSKLFMSTWSIKGADSLVTLVGLVISGNRLYEYKEPRNAAVDWWPSSFNRSTFKSPRKWHISCSLWTILMISNIRSLKISMQVLGILYITSSTTLDDKLKTFLSISINQHHDTSLFSETINTIVLGYIVQVLFALIKPCFCAGIIVNSSFSELICISSSSKCLGILLTF